MSVDAKQMASVWCDQGIELSKECHFPAARACFLRALQYHRAPDILANLANTCRALFQYEEADKYLDEAMAIDPKRARTYWIKGMMRMDQHRMDEAIGSLTGAIARDGSIYQIRFGRACARLWNGDWLKGFEDYQTRLRDGAGAEEPTPLWKGENLAGKRLVVEMEQGFGDCIMFSRYLDLIDAGDVIARVPGPMVRYFRQQGVRCCTKAAFPKADYRCLSMSLPVLLGLNEIPQPIEPRAPEGITLPLKPGGKFKIGIVWRSKAVGIDKPEIMFHGEQKSCPIEHFLTLAEIPGVELYSLQVGDAAKDANRALGLVEPLLINDFEDIAGYVANLDLVVSVDTGPVHLAAAMGRHGIVVLNSVGSWQWQSGDQTPWWPTLQIVRQPSPGDWAGAFTRVREIVEGLV